MGIEVLLVDCKFLGWLKSNCRYERDVGVVCINEIRSIYILDFFREFLEVFG